MSQSPSASLLRLREADVVRFCGLAAAARGLESVARPAVIGGRRAEGWLEATITDRAGDADNPDRQTSAQARVEIAGDDPIAIRWRCSCRTMTDTSAIPPLACEHVAALLTAWIREPSSFATTTTNETRERSESSSTAEGEPAQTSQHQPRLRMAQPPLLKAPSIHRPHGEPTLSDELARLSTSDLLAVMRRVLGVEDGSPEARKLLESTLRDPPKLAALIGRLDQEPQTLLAEIALLGGSCTSADLDAIAVRAEQAPAELRTALAVLERHALLFPAPGLAGMADIAGRSAADAALRPIHNGASPHPWRQVAGWRIPPELRAAWRPTLPIAPLPARAPTGPPLLSAAQNASGERQHPQAMRVVRGSPQRLLLALALLAHAPAPYHPLHRGEGRSTRAAVSAGHTPPPRKDEPATSRPPFPLVPGDLPPQMAAEFARGAGVPVGMAQMARRVLLWAREQGNASLIIDMARLPASEGAAALKSAFTLWQQTELPAELADLALPGAPIQARFDQHHEALRPAALATEVVEARRFLLGLLRHAQTNTWYAFDALLTLLWRLHPGFLRGRQQAYSTPAWWLEQTGNRRPLRITVREEWFAAEGAFVRAWLAGPLHWWGVCDLTLIGDQPAAFRLTPLGAYLLATGDANAPTNDLLSPSGNWGSPVLVTHNGRLAAQPLATGRALLDALATWARPESVAGGRIVYAFDAGLANAALDQGMTPDHLFSLLRAADKSAGQRALATAQAQIATWRAHYGATRLTSGWTLIEARDEATLGEALAYVPDLAAQCRRISPAHMLAPPEVADRLEVALQRRGYHF